MTGTYVNQLDLIASYLTQISAKPDAQRWHVVAYADEIAGDNRYALLSIAGYPALQPSPPRLSHFNLIHLSFPNSAALLRSVSKYALTVGGPTELLIFGPSEDGCRIELHGARTETEVYCGHGKPSRPLQDNRRRVERSHGLPADTLVPKPPNAP